MVASLVCDHYEQMHGPLTLKQLDSLLRLDAWQHYKSFCRAKGKSVASCSMQFNLCRFARESWQSYPELASCYKAAVVKSMLYWVATFLDERKDAGSPSSILRADTAYAMAQFQFIQDTHGAWFDLDTANQAAGAGRRFLVLYQQLALFAMRANRKIYRLTPKFHCLLHVTLRLPREKRNPRFDHLYMEEDYMRHIGRIASRTHARTMGYICLLRYRALLEMYGLGKYEESKRPHRFLKHSRATQQKILLEPC